MATTTEIVLVTPDLATKWLENLMDNQRPIKQDAVDRLAAEIVDGKWGLTWDAITIINGKLGNGQHRCWAIATAGIPCECAVMHTDDMRMMERGDGGVPRSIADIIGGDYRNFTQNAANWVLAYDKGRLRITSRQSGKTLRSEALDFIHKNRRELSRLCGICGPLCAKNRVLPTGAAVALILLIDRYYPGKGEEFVHCLYTGINTHGTVIWLLRERLVADHMKRDRPRIEYHFGLAIKTFNNWIKGRSLGNLKISEDEDFPVIEKPE